MRKYFMCLEQELSLTGLGQVVGEVRSQERGSYRAASYLGESSELEAETVIRYVTTEHLCELMVLQHLEDTIHRISKIKEMIGLKPLTRVQWRRNF